MRQFKTVFVPTGRPDTLSATRVVPTRDEEREPRIASALHRRV
jgi:hypothetical protein